MFVLKFVVREKHRLDDVDELTGSALGFTRMHVHSNLRVLPLLVSYYY
jgi:hypothetical protein